MNESLFSSTCSRGKGSLSPPDVSCLLQNTHLSLIELVFQCLVTWVSASTSKDRLILLYRQTHRHMYHEKFYRCLCARVCLSTDTVRLAHRVGVCNLPHFIIVRSSSQLGQALRVEHANARIELVPVISVESCSKGVYGDDEGTAISFKLWQIRGYDMNPVITINGVGVTIHTSCDSAPSPQAEGT